MSEPRPDILSLLPEDGIERGVPKSELKCSVTGTNSGGNTTFPNFMEVAAVLRRNVINRHYADLSHGKPYDSYVPVRQAMEEAEGEMAVQALSFLYDHLTFHEQWKKALALLAYSVPASLISDIRIRKIIEHAQKNVEAMEDAETERANFYLTKCNAMEDSFLDMFENMPQRARYWLMVSRFRDSKRCLEYGTDCGLNVHWAAKFDSKIQWYGTDISEKQVSFNKEQADRSGADNADFIACDDERFFGTMDTVAVLDTLEHTAHPYELLDKAEKFVAPGGAVVVSVPLGAWSGREQFHATLVGQHIDTQSLGGLQALLSARGDVVDIQPIHSGGLDPSETSACATYVPKGS